MAFFYAVGSLIGMTVTGACKIPSQYAAIEHSRERDRALCRHTRWNLHRNEQLKKLIGALNTDLDKYIEPATQIAEASRQNWLLSQSLLRVDKTIMYVNAGVLAVVMVMYVLLAWLALFKKRSTLQQAFSAVRNIHVQAG